MQQDNGDEQYEYNQDEYQYNDDQLEVQDEDIETKVQIDFYDAEQLIRKDQIPKAIQLLKQLYRLSVQNNLRTWKPKILNCQLQIFVKKSMINQLKEIFDNLLTLHQKEKLAQSSVKSIISSLKLMDDKSYDHLKQTILNFIDKMDPTSSIKGYLFSLEKAVKSQSIGQAEQLIQKINKIWSKSNASPEEILTYYCLQIKLSVISKTDITAKIKSMQWQLPLLQKQAYLNDNSLSVIMEKLAQIHYKQYNYVQSAQYLCLSFQQNVRYGKNAAYIKTLLIKSALIAILCEDQQIITSDKYNPLYHECSSPFKAQKDIFDLYQLIKACNQLDTKQIIRYLDEFNKHLKGSVFQDCRQRILQYVRKQLLSRILPAYKRIKFSYLQQRLKVSKDQIERLVFKLIANQRINAKIYQEQGFIEVLPPPSQYLITQLENIRQLALRY